MNVKTEPSRQQAIRGSILHFLDDPAEDAGSAFESYEDGLLIVEDGYISKVGDAHDLLPTLRADAHAHRLLRAS